MTPPARSKNHPDVVALVFGILFTCAAAGVLWKSFGGTFDPGLLRVGVPLLLVGLGVIGLQMSRGNG